MTHCARCGAPLIGGQWNIPTERGLLSFCTACVEPPRLPPMERPAPVVVVSALRWEKERREDRRN